MIEETEYGWFKVTIDNCNFELLYSLQLWAKSHFPSDSFTWHHSHIWLFKEESQAKTLLDKFLTLS